MMMDEKAKIPHSTGNTLRKKGLWFYSVHRHIYYFTPSICLSHSACFTDKMDSCPFLDGVDR